MPTTIQIILALLFVLMPMGGLGAARRQRARREHSKGKVQNGDL